MPTGEIRVDPSGRLAGRGAYVCPAGDCLSLALTKGGLARALSTPIPAELRPMLIASADTKTIQGGARGQE